MSRILVTFVRLRSRRRVILTRRRSFALDEGCQRSLRIRGKLQLYVARLRRVTLLRIIKPTLTADFDHRALAWHISGSSRLDLPKETVLTDDSIHRHRAGSCVAASARRGHGARVLIAEADRVGGTCGCADACRRSYMYGSSPELHEAEDSPDRAWRALRDGAGRCKGARTRSPRRHLSTMLAESASNWRRARASVAPNTVAVVIASCVPPVLIHGARQDGATPA